MSTVYDLTIAELADIATIVGVLVATAAFVINVRSQIKQRSIDACIRYLDFHQALFGEGGYLRKHTKGIEQGNYTRDETNEGSEDSFREMLSAFEKLALLHNSGGAPESINAYMLGFFAKKIYPALNDREKAEPYWELAVEFLFETDKAAKKFDNLEKTERLKYLSKNHF